MRKKIMIFTIAALLCTMTVSLEAGTVNHGVITLESKEVIAGSTFTVEIKLTGNSEHITSLRIPLTFDQNYLSCAYVDFNGTLLGNDMEALYSITAEGIEIAYIPPVIDPLPVIAEDSGLIATLYMTVSADSPVGIQVINDLNYDESFEQFGTTFHRWTRPEMTNGSGLNTLLPALIPSVLTVQRPTDVVDEAGGALPDEFVLYQNYPNPFNPSTILSFSLPQKTDIRLEVFNILGQVVAILAEGEFPAGFHQVEWQADNVPTGIYFYKLATTETSLTGKMLLMK